MSTDGIRVGIVGAGNNTRTKHIPGLRAIDGVEIVGVCNRTVESSQRVADAHGIPEVFERWSDLVQAPNVDAVLIGTWPYMHCTLTVAALQAGKHVLCEARMAGNAAEAREMLRASRRRPNLVAQVVPSPYTLGVDATVKRLIAGGYLGRVLAVEVRSHTPEFLDGESPMHWRHDFSYSGYNILDLGIRYEAMMRWVGEATRVMAMGQTFVTMRRDEAGSMRAVRIPEHLDVIAEMACGAQAHFQHSTATGLAGVSEMTLFGSDGTLRFAEDTLYGGRRGDEGLQEIAIPREEAGGWRVEAEFVNAIRGIEPVTHTTFADGVTYMEFVEGVSRSMLEGRAITLPL